MRKTVWPYAFFWLLILGSNVYALDKGQHLNQPPPPAARELVKRAVLLAESDKPWAAIAALRKALSLAPNYLPAHVEYRNVKANFLNRSDEVEAEYQSLIKRFPRNPVYLMAVYFRSNGAYGRESLQKVVELAPDWAWGHYAKALLIKEKDPESAVVEFQHCIEKDSSALAAYDLLIELQETRLHRIDDAIRTAKQLAAQTDIRSQLRLEQLWRLRLIKNQRSEEANAALANELSRLESSGEVDTLLAIRSAYLNILKDSERASAIKHKIVALDPSWTPERGWLYMLVTRNQSQVPRHMVLVNRQIALSEKAADMAGATNISKEERIVHLKELLGQQPNAAVRRLVYEYIFRLAVSSGNATEVRKYGSRLHLMDPDDSALLSQMALVLADKRAHLNEALYFARKAERLTSEFRRARRPPNTSLDFLFPEQKQREQYKTNRALALDAVGWTLTQMRQTQQAETWLRQATEIERSEGRLWHLAKALQELGRNDEATVIETESNTFLASTIRKQFTNEPVGDLQLQSIEGRNLKLSDLKGKVVLIDFWATWCGPCVAEMPSLKKPVMRDYHNRETSNKRSSLMNIRSKSLAALICFPILFAVPSFAQSVARPLSNAAVLDRSPSVPQNTNPTDPIANEISLLRKSLQTLNTRLKEISEELLAPAKKDDNSNEKVKRIATNLDLLMHTEERAEVLRKQLIELIEKETSFKSRVAQIDEDMRPENIERALSGIGTTRTPELRDTRRRVLENERKGIESLLNLTTQSRVRLEEDVKQADQLVSRLRQRLFPLIEKEIDKINPN